MFFRESPSYTDAFMSAFPVHYAAFSSHYTQRALQRWITLNGMQRGMVDQVLRIKAHSRTSTTGIRQIHWVRPCR